MHFQRIPPERMPDLNLGSNTRTKVLDTGVAIETTVTLMNYSGGCPIRKLDADHYEVVRTKEIKEFKHTSKRTDNINSIACSMQKLRNIINYNVTDPQKVTWLTLTYAECMRDYHRLYDDFRKFNMRLRYYCAKHSLPHYEYIAVCEPQARGAWHMHVILVWCSDKAPFIANETIAKIWGNGFTKTTAVKGNIDSLGYYLSAYLTDLPLDEALETNADFSNGVKTKNDKQYAKAARLHLYPSGINFYRCSKGIKRPKPCYLSKYEADQMLAQREALLKRETYTYMYEDFKPTSFSMLSQHCYYDIRPCARMSFRLIQACRNGQYYRHLYCEMLSLMALASESQDYMQDCYHDYPTQES